MAEFQEVAAQKKRMCNTYDINSCNGCPLKNGDCGVLNMRFTDMDTVQRIETTVMAWAAEHPEPVYPSIAKYLEQFGIMIRRDGSLQADFFRANEPMSAEIAKLLGISSGVGENEKTN